ncbi:hypothetical protein Pla123a_46290 [Posidoniimonas polymericola]|uniref:Cna protein B-type domain protein n=1 Tax=Posidoniimonas polymericola TaxID=2528002 RepID=A0A5C5XW39_9BACT|nr:carboxypeptidase-like regulatory domain-containing protein [Posidoniimonas polymericola]TWT66741.1 hypothetical protein Pla123a_46290 [Posidoniimonas polymericola]
MKIMTIQKVAAAAAMFGMMLPQATLAAAPAATQGDIALRNGGVFVGQYVDAQGNGVSGAEVAMVAGGKSVAVTKTDKQGRFAVKGLQSGQYDVVAMNSKTTFRCWEGKVAPPSARNGALIVTGDAVVTGQGGVLGFIQTYPLLTATAVTAAIAIPVGIAAADDDAPASP